MRKATNCRLPLTSSSPKWRHTSILLCIYIMIIALVAVHVPFSLIRIIAMTAKADGGTTSAGGGGGANDDEKVPINSKSFMIKNEPTTIASSTTSKDTDTDIGTEDTSAISLKEASIAIESGIVDKVNDNADDEAASAPPNSSNTRMHVDYHNNRFDYSSWCPHAKCKGSPLCYPCQRRWLIIITTGRSASTTLTQMMARLPGVRMTGENNNLVGRFDNILKEAPKDMLNGTAAAWFHNPIPEDSWSCASQTLFTTANPPKLVNGELLESDEKTILGFKEIRLFDSEVHEKSGTPLSQTQVLEIAKAKVEILNYLFPCARFVVNYRSDMNSQVESWKKLFSATDNIRTTQILQLDNDLLRMFQKIMGPYRSFLLDSTEWTQNIAPINHMVEWLGFSPKCHFKEALAYNTKDGYDATKTEVDLSQDCTYLH